MDTQCVCDCCFRALFDSRAQSHGSVPFRAVRRRLQSFSGTRPSPLNCRCGHARAPRSEPHAVTCSGLLGTKPLLSLVGPVSVRDG